MSQVGAHQSVGTAAGTEGECQYAVAYTMLKILIATVGSGYRRQMLITTGAVHGNGARDNSSMLDWV